MLAVHFSITRVSHTNKCYSYSVDESYAIALNMPMEILKNFGKRVQKLRTEAGWSQEVFAELTGLHRTYISGIERGIRNPTLLIVQRIANSLSISPSELLKIED